MFIFPPGFKSQDDKSFDFHLGSSYLIAYLRSKGFNAQQFIHSEPVTLKNCVRRILDHNPAIAGFTVYDSNFNVSVLIARQIKKLSPLTLIVFGGPTPTVHSDFIMTTYPFVDMCFVNYSEDTLLKLISALSEKNYDYKKTDLTGFKGMSFRHEGKYCKAEKFIPEHPATVKYLDRYPSPILSGILPAAEAYSTGLITARGCNQNCVYCNCAVMSDGKIFKHSVGRIIGELDFISKNADGNQILAFNDDAFTLIPHRAKEICSAIIANKIKIRLGCITRCDRIDESLLDCMKEAGFVSIGLSLESANPVTLRRIGKICKAEDQPSFTLRKEISFIERFDSMTAYAKKIGIKNVFASIMVGLPGETPCETRKTIETIDKNKNIDLYAHNFLNIYKGTPLYESYKQYGYELDYINNNPVFTRLSYPSDVGKIRISKKSTLHQNRKSIDKSTLGILALKSAGSDKRSGIRNVILQSDLIRPDFVLWLREILSLNGTIIQIYKDEKSMKSLALRNKETLIRCSSPSLNIRNYFLSQTGNTFLLLSSDSLLLKTGREDSIKICDFEYIRSKMDDPYVSFTKTLCRESNQNDSASLNSFLREIGKEKDPYSFLTGKKVLPYFADLCKWSRDMANCRNRNTIIVNEKDEIRFCWFGTKTGSVGQSYDEIVRALESEMKRAIMSRKCTSCKAGNHCIKCPSPFPLTELEYCNCRKSIDVSHVAETIIGLDAIKQLLL